jgi:acyl-CoA thioester hydrolase
MPRVQLTPRKSYQFEVELQVRITDLNYGGHLANDRVLALLHEARVAYLASHGWTEMDCGGVSLIMTDVSLVFRGEGFAGDRLTCAVTMAEPSRCGFRLFYLLTRRSDDTQIAVAESSLACFDYQARRVVALPDPVRTACAAD